MKLTNLLNNICGDINRYFTANSFMTERDNIDIFDMDYHSDYFKKYIESNNYDIVLAKNSNNDLFYITRESLMKNGNSKDIFLRIPKNEKIDSNELIPEIIEKFKKYYCVFVYDKTEFNGLITYADLNKSPIYSYSYIVISKLEKYMRNYINLRYQENKWFDILPDGKQKEVSKIYNDEKAKGIEISLLECTTLTHLIKLFEKEKIFKFFAFCEGKNDFKSKSEKMINFRNDVMHCKPLIHNNEGGKYLYNTLGDFCNLFMEIKKLSDNDNRDIRK